MKVEIYTDGSATTKEKPGGYGYVIVVDGNKALESSGHISKATNNVAELTAAIRGLAYVAGDAQLRDADEIVLISDSQLVLKYATGEYQCKKFHLVPLNIELKRLFNNLKATTRWVKGHAGDEHNERCDVLAKSARANPNTTS